MNNELYSDDQILAIFPNVKGFGYAFFRNDYEPVHANMAVVQPPCHTQCLKRIDAMVQTFQPNIILLPTADGKRNRKKKRIQELLSEITHYAQKQHIEVKTYSREQIRLIFEQFDAYSKQDIAEKICLWMPDIEKRRPIKRKADMPEDYYQGMFDAISLFITHQYITQ